MKLTNFPLPPKNSEVVQKLQPIGQPTELMIVAAALPPPRGIGNPISLKPNDDAITGCRIGCPASSPRNSRSHATPSPLTIWSASIIDSTPGIAVTCPPTTIVDLGE